ncbi:MAG: AMP-binding protein [Pseudomonadota bacterium]
MRPIDYFERGARLAPDSMFLKGEHAQLSFAESSRQIDAVARGLFAAGFELDDSIAVYAPNDPMAVICVFSSMRAGGAWVPVNVRNSAATNAEYMAYVDTRWLFFHSKVAKQAKVVMDAIPELKGAICIDGNANGCPSLEEFCALGAGTEIPDWSDPFGAADNIFSRWPTGGTTGPSKGVEMSNANIVTMFELGLQAYVGDEIEQVVHLAVAPITHAAGVIIGIFAAVGGGTVVHESFDPRAVLESIEKDRITHMFLPPTAYYALLDHPDTKIRDLSSLRKILLAAAPVSPDKFKRGVDVFGPVICQCYGQAEAPMLISMLAPEVVAAAAKGDHPDRLKSCGKVTTNTLVAILDEEGNEMPVGERGEICCRGPLVTPGYYKQPQATAEARKFGWHHTGDVGYVDKDDYLYIVDRKKDMIITGGFNVFATEVEAPILALPEVLECAVIGVPDERWGESIKAVVVLNEGTRMDSETIRDAIKDKLGGVKTPKSIEIWDEIPKTAVGKTDKKVIRAQFWTDAERGVN